MLGHIHQIKKMWLIYVVYFPSFHLCVWRMFTLVEEELLSLLMLREFIISSQQ